MGVGFTAVSGCGSSRIAAPGSLRITITTNLLSGLRVEVWVIGGETLGRRSFHEIVISGDEHQGREAVSGEGAVESKRTCQMYGIVPAQTILRGQLDRLVYDRSVDRDQDIRVVCVACQVGAGVVVLRRCDVCAS
jgi:hypothetical protein